MTRSARSRTREAPGERSPRFKVWIRARDARPAWWGASPRARRIGEFVNPAADVVALAVTMGLVGRSPVVGVYLLLVLVALTAGDPRQRRLMARVSEDVGWLLRRLAWPLLLVGPVAPFMDQTSELIVAFVLATAAVFVSRGLGYALHRQLRRGGLIAARTLIVGTGPVGRELGRMLDEHPEYGLRVIGYVEVPHAASDDDPSVVAAPDELVIALRSLGVERLVVAFGVTRAAEMVPILRACDEQHVTVYHVPRFFELGVLPDMPEHEDVWGLPLVRLRRSALLPSARVGKRAFDLAVTSLVLLLAGPVMLVIALLVRFTSPGPVLFRQRRVGRNGREFDVLKFRSMQVNDDSDVMWSVVGDKRLTPIGGFLRRTSLDELPQLINVLRGEMSLVGPRPERPVFVAQFGARIPGYHDRHRVPVGVTGWAQVHGLRGDTSIEHRARLDNYYIENWSLWLDLVILFRTFIALRTPA